MDAEKLKKLQEQKELHIISDEEYEEQLNILLYGKSLSQIKKKDANGTCYAYKEYSCFHYFLKCLKKMFVFKGRARRKEYWGFILFSTLITFCIHIYNAYTTLQMLFAPKGFHLEELLTHFFVYFIIAELIFILPTLSVSVRRLHDIGCSGWWSVIVFSGIIVPVLQMYEILGENTFGSVAAWFGVALLKIYYFILTVTAGSMQRNRYGEVPDGLYQ